MGSTVEIGVVPGGTPVLIPDSVRLLTAAFDRHGQDLRLSDPDGNAVLVREYFAGGVPADLVTDAGALVHGGTARILASSPAFVQLAQAGGAPAGLAPIGKVRLVAGDAKLIRGGVEQDATQDTDVYLYDVLATGPGGSLAVRFVDGTSFALGPAARMTLDQFAYNPQGGSGQMLLSVLQGTFSFVSGAIAKTGDDAMKVQMPTMTIGIRGTTVAGQAMAEGSESSATLLRNFDGTIGAIFTFNSQSGYLITQSNFTVFSSSQFAGLQQPSLIVDLGRYQDALNALQTLQRTAADSETDVAQLNQSPADQALARLLAQAETGSGGEGAPGGLNYNFVTFSDLGISVVVFTANGQTFAALFNAGGANEPVRPAVPPAGDESEHHRQDLNGQPGNSPPVVTTAAIAADDKHPATGHILASDPDGDALTFGVAQPPNLGTLVLNPDGGYVYTPGAALAGLAAGQAATDTFQVLVSDGRGGVTIQTVTVTIAGINDAPAAPVDVNPAANTVAEGAAKGTVVGVVAKATDIDGDPITYSLSDDAGGRFAIDSKTGIVTVANGKLLDFESAASHTITVVASDGALSASAAFTIAVIDSPNDGRLALSGLHGAAGFTINGAAIGGFAGASVSSAGDVNGDGFDDLIIGAPGTDANGYNSGSAYVVFGRASAPATVELSGLDGTNGFRIDGASAIDFFGRSVSSAGDVNGDGFADFIIGADLAGSSAHYAGSSYVVFGKASGFPAVVQLSALEGTVGFRLDGVSAYDRSGYAVSSAGDVNGDGFDDLIVGAPAAHGGAGASYVVFGKAGGFAAVLDLASLDGTTGFRIDGAAAGDRSGQSVASEGDVNGDGFDDLIVGAAAADPHGPDSGSAYLVFGRASGIASAIDLSSLDGTTGFRIDGVSANDWAGFSVSSAGDVNGDGFDDLIIGAPVADANGVRHGSSYVVFGHAPGFAAVLDLSSLDGVTGFRLDGVADFDLSGWSVSSAGDVNGDGFDDLLVGALLADGGGVLRGESYVVYGHAGGFAATIALSGVDGTTGFRIDGASDRDYAGISVSSAGDVNGDGFDDLIVGAANAGPNGNGSGQSYVLFGGNFTGAAAFLGTAGNDALAGTSAAERFVGGLGDDTLTGNGGADVFEGGAGNDLIRVADLNFQRVDGGGNDDRLLFEAAVGAVIDLSNLHGKIQGVEQLDFTNGLANTILIRASDVLDLQVRNTDVNDQPGLDNALKLLGDGADTVSLIGGWTGQGADSGGAGFEVYAYDAAPEIQVVIDQNLMVNTGP